METESTTSPLVGSLLSELPATIVFTAVEAKTYYGGNDSAVVAVNGTLQDIFPYVMMVFAVVEYILMALIVVVNLFILMGYAVGRNRSNNSILRLPSSGRLVLNLALADLLVGIGLCYFSLFKFWPDLAAELARYMVPCVLRFAICFLTMFGSHCALFIVALDRYTAIVHTLHYKDYMTTRVSWCLILGGWAVPLVGSASTFLINQWYPGVPSCNEHYIVPQFLLAFALPTNVFILVAIYIAHWRVHKEVKAFTLRCADPGFVASSRRSNGCRKSAVVLLRVTTTFLVCWTPLDVMLVLLVVIGPQTWVLLLFEATFLLAMISFLLNPIVYAWSTEAIRRQLIDVLVSVRVFPPSSNGATRGPRAQRAQGGPGNAEAAETVGASRDVGVFTITRDSVHSGSYSHSSSSGTTSGSYC